MDKNHGDMRNSMGFNDDKQRREFLFDCLLKNIDLDPSLYFHWKSKSYFSNICRIYRDLHCYFLRDKFHWIGRFDQFLFHFLIVIDIHQSSMLLFHVYIWFEHNAIDYQSKKIFRYWFVSWFVSLIISTIFNQNSSLFELNDYFIFN